LNETERDLLTKRMAEYNIVPDFNKIVDFALLKKRDTIELHYK